MRHTDRKTRLEALLLGFQRLWRPQPFKIETPEWCGEFPALAEELLALDDDAIERLGADNEALIGWVSRHVPELSELAELITLLPSPASGGGVGGEGNANASGMRTSNTPSPGATRHPPPPAGEGRLFTDIPGRKQAQIEAYADALGQPRAPLLEWCAGKGHLGRLLAHRWHWPVASLEIDATLCDAGEDLARHAHVDCMQHFIRADALAADAVRHITGRHAVALHACGDLHTRLIADSAAQASPAIDVAPCCYYRTAHPAYRPFNATELVLSHDDLRLAVTETVTASAKQRRQSRRALAWKLGWVELRKTLTGETDYRTFPPVPEAWLRGDFAGFVGNMLARERARGFAHVHSPSPTLPRTPPPLAGEGLRPALDEHSPLPQAGEGLGVGGDVLTKSTQSPQAGEGLGERGGKLDLAAFESLGHARAARMLRLQLVRLTFRRPLEIWLLMDMAVFLENQGYAVEVRPFCAPSLTPRNLLLSARRYT